MAYGECRRLIWEITQDKGKISDKYFTINIYGLYFLEDDYRQATFHKAAYKCTGSYIMKQLNTVQEAGYSRETAAEQVVSELYAHASEYLYSLRKKGIIQWLTMLDDVYKLGLNGVEYDVIPSTPLRKQLINFQLGEVIRSQRQAIEDSVDSSL